MTGTPRGGEGTVTGTPRGGEGTVTGPPRGPDVAVPGPQRSTRQRSAIAALLAELDSFHSAQMLHAMLRDRGQRLGLTTVYRTLQALAATGEVDVMRPPSGEHLYRRCGLGHHHHLVCRGCGATVEVDGPAVERWADRVAAEHGYSEVSHTLEIFGICRACSR